MQRPFFLLSFLLLPLMSLAQRPFISIFQEKAAYFDLLHRLEKQEEKVTGIELSAEITIAYQMVVLELTGEGYGCELRYWQGEFYDAYCSKSERLPHIKALKPQPQDSSNFQIPAYWQDSSLVKYLEIAAEIAALGASCGTDYFSEMLITEKEIKISQIDWHNAKLLGATSYSMWTLIFTIPLKKEKTKKNGSFGEYWIGNMRVEFSDHSKPQNSCSQPVLEKIKQWAADF